MATARRNALLIAAALLAAAAGALFLAHRLRERGIPGAPSIGSLTPVELPPLLDSPIEALRVHARPGLDPFAGESVGAEIEERLRLLERFVRAAAPGGNGAAAAEALDLFAAGLEATPLQPAQEMPIRRGGGVEVFLGRHADGLRPAAPRDLAAGFRALLAPAERVEGIAFKIVRVAPPERPGEAAATEILYQIAGAGGAGARLQWNGRLEISWVPEPWRIRSLRVREGLRAALARRPFTDVTAFALGGNRSYREQLLPSIDFFRDRIDAAAGIDVYGHHGIAAADLDGDRIEDVYLPEPAGLPNLLFRNNGDGTFADVSRESGADLLDGASQALLIDLDNDGDRDIFLVGEGGIITMRNDGRGRFEPAASGVEGLGAGASTMIAAAAADYDRDGWIDVYVACYVFWRGNSGRVGSRLPLPYHEARNGAPNFLLRNRGDGTFEDATERAGLAPGNDRFSFAAAWGDYDDDGWPDIYVANDFGSNNLYRNRGDGTFEEKAAAAGVEDTGAGMSAAWEDFDNDGRLDLYTGNMFSTAGLRVTGAEDYKRDSPALQGIYRRHARGNSLFRNRGGGAFEDVSIAARAFFGRWAWSSDFIDFDLDGREDIYIASGFVTGADTGDL